MKTPTLAGAGALKNQLEPCNSIVHKLNLQAALQHVRMLAGRDDAPVTIVAIKSPKEIDARRGSVASMWSWIEAQQTVGYHIYITVNETAGVKRTKDDITRVRAIYLDDDHARQAPRDDWPLRPHMIVESSPGKFHYYWLTDAEPDSAIEDLMRGMADRYGTDDSAIDVSRVLRLAGTVNLKPGAGGHVARIVLAGDHARCMPAELFAAFPRYSDSLASGHKPSFDATGALATIESAGEGLHDALRGVAAHMAARGLTEDVIRPLLEAHARHHSDGTPRYAARIAEIPGLVKSAVDKFLQPDVLDASDPLDFFASAQARTFGFVAADYPDSVARFALDLAQRMGCDPLIPAWTMLVAAAGLLPDRFGLQVKARDTTWQEKPRLWVALVGDPSSKKSPPMSAIMAPIEKLQAGKAREHEAAMARWLDACASAKKEKRSEPPAPVLPRLLVHDTTTEALALILHTTPSGMLMVQDELSGFFGAMDAYRANGASKDVAFYLQAYNGAPFIVDRVSKTIAVPHLSLSIIGGIQPDPMRAIAKNLREDGLLQRHIVIPTSASDAGADVEVDAEAASDWAALVDEIAQLRDADGMWPDTYRLEPDAQQILDAGRRRLDTLARDPSTDRRLAIALAKGEGQLARLVLVYHLIENRSDLDPFEMGADTPSAWVTHATVAKAVRVFFSLVVPAQFDFYTRVIGESEHQQQCRRVAGYILARELESISDRDVYREALKELGDNAQARDAVMRSLELSGWLAPNKDFKGRTTQWTVNPKVHGKFALQATAERARRKNIVASIRGSLK